jgi:MFS family permease
MTALLGVAISSTIIGAISDKIGRKICIMVSLWGSTFGSALKFFLSFNFWAFCGANFLNGLFSAALPVALAYVGDATPTREEKRSEIGALVGFSMIGMSGGGICAILMSQQGLFMPLWVSL